MTRLAIIAYILLIALAHARDNGQWAQVDPATRDWFQNQISPKTQQSCCSIADGTYAEEDIRAGVYWVRFIANGVAVDWMEVPDDVVIRGPNRHGRAVVWFLFENGVPTIRCFIPGAGI